MIEQKPTIARARPTISAIFFNIVDDRSWVIPQRLVSTTDLQTCGKRHQPDVWASSQAWSAFRIVIRRQGQTGWRAISRTTDFSPISRGDLVQALPLVVGARKGQLSAASTQGTHGQARVVVAVDQEFLADGLAESVEEPDASRQGGAGGASQLDLGARLVRGAQNAFRLIEMMNDDLGSSHASRTFRVT